MEEIQTEKKAIHMHVVEAQKSLN